MKNSLKFDIYESFTKKRTTKKYIVTSINDDYEEVMKFAKRFFHCSEAHLDFTIGYLYEDELYLESPHLKGTRSVGVVHFVR